MATLAQAREKPDAEALAAWWAQIEEWRAKDCLKYDRESAIIKPQYVIEKLYEVTKGDAFVTSDVGQHQMWAAQFYKFDKPRRWINSGGLGTMGVGLPVRDGRADGASRRRTVACVTGEASIQMCIQELSTCKQYRLPIKMVNLNNRYMGMVRQWQEFFHGNRYSRVVHGRAARFREARRGLRPRRHAHREAGRRRGRAARGVRAARTDLVFLDFITDQTENVFPMVPGGKGLSEMILRDLSGTLPFLADCPGPG